jgi:hypothetical protein
MTRMTGAAFKAELKARGFRTVGNRIVSDECPASFGSP